jgi:hypothetical protein
VSLPSISASDVFATFAQALSERSSHVLEGAAGGEDILETLQDDDDPAVDVLDDFPLILLVDVPTFTANTSTSDRSTLFIKQTKDGRLIAMDVFSRWRLASSDDELRIMLMTPQVDAMIFDLLESKNN